MIRGVEMVAELEGVVVMKDTRIEAVTILFLTRIRLWTASSERRPKEEGMG